MLRLYSSIALLLFATLGCAPAEELGRVSGKVTIDERPLARGVVMFANKEKGVYMTAPIGARLAHRLPQLTLKRAFAIFLGLIALNMLYEALTGAA